MAMSNATAARTKIAPNLYERKTADGSMRYEAKYTAPDGRYVSKTLAARNRTEAKAELGGLLHKRARGEMVAPSRQTFQAVWNEFMATLEGMVAAGERGQRTYDSYAYHGRTRILPLFGRRQLQKITANDLGDAIAEWRRKGLAPWTIRSTLVPLGRCLNFAVRRGYIHDNPMRKLEAGERPRVTRTEVRILSHEEIKKLIASASATNRPIITTAVFTGLRLQELLGLSWENVDLDAGVIRVRAQLTRGTAKEPAKRIALLKTDAACRDVVLLPQLATLLKQHRQKLFASGLYRADGLVFVTSAGTPFNHRNVARGLETAAKKAELLGGDRKLSMHTLRHCFVSYLIVELGFDPVRVAEQVGHGSPSFTLDRYSHVFRQRDHAEDLRRRMEQSAFGALLGRVES
jgi:integrase